MIRPLLLGALALALTGQPSAIAQDAPPVEAVNKAIDLGVEYLIGMQEADGSWGSDHAYFPGDTSGGETALILAALLHSGLKWEHQAIQRGVTYVRQTPPTKYYGACTRLLMEEILLARQDEDHIEAATELILDGAGRGYWDYPGDQLDLSNTQYALLGLWLAHKAGVKIPDKVYEKTMKVCMQYQLPDGGWAYFGPLDGGGAPNTAQSANEYPATASMTTAGMATVLFCFDALSEKKSNIKKYQSDVDESMAAGHAWLDQHMTYDENVQVGGERRNQTDVWYYYFLYNIERLSTIADLETLAGKNWYNAGAAELIKRQMRSGGWSSGPSPSTTDTAFALLFLNKATNNTRSGEGADRQPTFLAVEEGKEVDVDLRILPGVGCYGFVAGFGASVRERYAVDGKFGMHIETVKYFVDGELYKQFDYDVTRSAANERFTCPLELEPGRRQISVEVTAAPAPANRGDEISAERIKLKSAAFTLNVDWTMTEEQSLAMDEVGKSLAVGNPPEVSVSSEIPFNNPNEAKGGVSLYIGDRAVDGSMAYGWVAGEEDTQPWIRMVWGKGLKVQTVVLTPARRLPVNSNMRASNEFAAPKKVILKINGKETEHELGPDPRQRIELPKVTSIKTLEIRIIETHPTEGKFTGTGFAEVELLAAEKKKKKR
ncbi:MAG: terpene cyclase/mutase family protein [Planctomycetota bacterium]|nr:terpene cyclase/mutase family protein [Planctomycetota bacterium]